MQFKELSLEAVIGLGLLIHSASPS